MSKKNDKQDEQDMQDKSNILFILLILLFTLRQNKNSINGLTVISRPVYNQYPHINKENPTPNYFYDEDHVRYELYQSNDGENYNWLMFPGGPGADSCYLRTLVDVLKLPGNVWLVDLPGNGSNVQANYTNDFDN